MHDADIRGPAAAAGPVSCQGPGQEPGQGPGQGPIRLGVARCLLGDHVRYDGGHKFDPFVVHGLGRFVELMPVCPEVECGMPVPREAIRLEGDPAAPRLRGRQSGHDFTDQMQDWATVRLDDLETQGLCGYVFKSRSPSSGMERIKVYPEGGGQPTPTGVGIWARMFMERFPLLPVEDDGRLHDHRLRENFVTRIFVFKRWRDMFCQRRTVGGLVDFHTRHKLLLLSHNEVLYRDMGRLVAGARSLPLEQLFKDYLHLLTKALSYKTTAAKNVNVLMHCLGYFKADLTTDEKQEMLDLLAGYKAGHVPLIVPVTLMNHYVRKYGQPYLRDQVYLNPHPVELQLRNHV